jgi:hypothetical protein
MPAAKSPRDLQFVDHVLTNVARAYMPHGFIADQVAPRIPVTLDSGKYPVFDGFFDDDVDPKVGDRAETPEVDFTWSEDTYFCEDYRLAASITKKEERNAHSALRLRQNKLSVVLTRLALRRERRVADLLRKTTNGGLLTLGANTSNKWNTGSSADIEGDVKTGAVDVYNNTGYVTNVIAMSFPVAYEIALNADIREIVKYTVDGREVLRLGDRLLPATLHGHQVVIAKGAMRNTAKEGATRSLSDIWGDSVRLLYVPEGGGGWGIPSTAYQFTSEPEVVDRWRENDPPVEKVRAWETVDEKVCGPAMGYEIGDVL